jgi:hypothetical protein
MAKDRKEELLEEARIQVKNLLLEAKDFDQRLMATGIALKLLAIESKFEEGMGRGFDWGGEADDA